MNIQKMVIDDQTSALSPRAANGGGSGGAAALMSVPDVGAPAANPLAMIWRRRGVLAIVVAVCVLAALVWYLVSPRIYQSVARLYVSFNNVRAAGGDASPTSLASQLQRECDRIRNKGVVSTAVAALEGMKLETLDVPDRGSVLTKNLGPTVSKDNELIVLTFDSPKRTEAQLILKTVVDAYSNFYTERKRGELAKGKEDRLHQEAALQKLEDELIEFKKANGLLSLGGEKGDLEVEKAASLQRALTQQHIEVVNLSATYNGVRGKLNDPVELKALADYLRATGMVTGSDPNEQALRKQLFDVEEQLRTLQQRLMNDHPAVRASIATAAELRARVAAMDRGVAERYILTIGQQLEAAKAREADFKASYDEQKQIAAASSAAYTVLARKEAEIKRVRDRVEKITMNLQELEASESAGVPTITVFDQPTLPSAPIKPLLPLMAFQGLMIGLVLGGVAALVRDWTDQGLRNAEEVTEATGLPLLGSVPHVPGPPNPMSNGRKVDLEPASDVAEMYRTIRTAVFFGTPDRESRTILVTSPAPGDGKSTFASNLAIAMAQTGKRVLLVDCDFRRPVQHRVFESRPGAGMSSVLMGKESLDHAIQNTGISGLDILPAGPIPTNPSEMLNSQSFTEVLEELSVRYEHVVVDSPPVMAVADARILAAMCSVTILVLRAEATTRKAAVHSRRALESVGAHILGVVVNDVPRARDRYGEYGGYSSYRAKYNGHAPGATYVPTPPTPTTTVSEMSPANPKSTAIIPAQSFLDLRRK